MEELPNELFEKIFDNIDEDEKKSVREVCTKWYGMNPMEKMVIKDLISVDLYCLM